MPPIENIKSWIDLGLGPLSFVVLMIGIWKAAKFAEKLMDNHLAHFQASLDTLVKNSTEANVKLDQQNAKLDRLLDK